MAVDKEIKEQL
jgi:serine/threonine protein kinase